MSVTNEASEAVDLTRVAAKRLLTDLADAVEIIR